MHFTVKALLEQIELYSPGYEVGSNTSRTFFSGLIKSQRQARYEAEILARKEAELQEEPDDKEKELSY